jgi:hypothetical protein
MATVPRQDKAGLENVTMLVLILLAVVWAAVLVPPFVRNRRNARPDNSVVSFRAQLSTLERATPGTSLRSVSTSSSSPSAPVTVSGRPRSGSARRSDVKRRRREVLVTLLGATGFTFVLLVTVGGTLVTTAFLASAGGLGAYVFALRQLRARSMERVAKVRPLVRRVAPLPTLDLRRTVSN